MNIPNLLTLFRILLVPIFVTLLIYGQTFYAFLAFIIAGVTDALDGFIARVFSHQTVLVHILNRSLTSSSSWHHICPGSSRHDPAVAYPPFRFSLYLYLGQANGGVGSKVPYKNCQKHFYFGLTYGFWLIANTSHLWYKFLVNYLKYLETFC